MSSSTTSSDRSRSFLICALATLGGLLGATFAFNVIVDPYSAFRLFNARGLNARKYQPPSRIARNIAVAFGRLQGVILGSSRAAVALNPRHRGFGGRRMYNFALEGTDMNELYLAFEYIRRHNRLEIAVMALDFFMFSDKKNSDGGTAFYSPANDRDVRLLDITLTAHATASSLRTVWGNVRAEPARIDLGRMLLDAPEMADAFSAGFDRLGHWSVFESNLRAKALSADGYYTTYRYDPEKFVLLERIAKACRDDSIELRIFISPVHALRVEAIHAAGLGDVFDRWKRDLASLADPGPHGPVVIDFTGFEGFVAEPVPSIGSRMKWYYESSHYTKALGDRVLDRVLEFEAVDRPRSRDFGVMLDDSSIDEHLQTIRAQRAAYRKSFPLAVLAVEKLARTAEQRSGPAR